MIDSATPEEKHKSSPRRSPRESSEQRIPFEGPEGQTADPNASADIYAPSAAASKGSSNQQGGCRPRYGHGVRKRKVGRRAVSPSPSATSPQSSPVPSSPSPQSSRKTSRLLFSDAQSRSSCSRPISVGSDKSEPEPGPSTGQITPSPSPARTTRPTSQPRSASAPTPRTGSSDTNVKRAQGIDGDIEKQIREPKKLSKRDKELGYVYVVPACIDGKDVIKIGHTTETSVDTRLKAIPTGGCESTIKILELPPTSPEHTQVHLFYEQVEKLAHKELANFRYNFSCGCSKRHGEFFVVDEEIGHMVVERWARLCALRPFHKDCVLKDEWKFHLDRFRERNHNRLGTKNEEKDDHISRHQRWESFLASKRSDWYLHRAGVLRDKMWAHRWQMWSLVLATLLVISTLSWWSSGFLIVTAGCIDESARDSLEELTSLLRDMAVHHLRPVSGNPTSAANHVQQVEGTDGIEGTLDIWGASEEESEAKDRKQDEQEEEEEEKEREAIEAGGKGEHEGGERVQE